MDNERLKRRRSLFGRVELGALIQNLRQGCGRGSEGETGDVSPWSWPSRSPGVSGYGAETTPSFGFDIVDEAIPADTRFRKVSICIRFCFVLFRFVVLCLFVSGSRVAAMRASYRQVGSFRKACGASMFLHRRHLDVEVAISSPKVAAGCTKYV